LEWATVLGEYYGTPIPQPPEGHDVVLEIDVQGAEQVIARGDDVFCILLVPPSRAVQKARMELRGDSEAHVRSRLALADFELDSGTKLANAIVVNDDLETTIDELASIVKAARSGTLS
jgi:guanylate kinase